MKAIVSKLYNSSPKQILQQLRDKLVAPQAIPSAEHKTKEATETLQRLFNTYKTPNLSGITPEAFQQTIQSRIGVIDADQEGYPTDEVHQQRDLSVRFHWGHNHDFGTFQMEGRMRNRHIDLLANFIDLFPVSLEDFRDKSVFDIGCWTGGTTLLMATLASRVFAIEEVKKYAETTTFLAKSFGVDDKVSVESRSIYECDSEELYDQFDVTYFPGVIYHLSDPVLALRILFNSTKEGGFILVETEGLNTDEPICRFDGSLIYHTGGSKKNLNRGGWNWFLPSPSALYRMMKEAGFDQIETLWHEETGRVFGYGRKVEQTGICRAGLSVPNIK